MVSVKTGYGYKMKNHNVAISYNDMFD